MVNPSIAIISRLALACATEIIFHHVKEQYNPVDKDPMTNDSRLAQVLVIFFFYLDALYKYKSFLSSLIKFYL